MARSHKYMMESFRKIGKRRYQCLNIYDTKARAVKQAEEYRVGGYGATVVKLKQGWGFYRTPSKIHKEIKKPKTWWRARGYVTR
jgi:hypothetical protein